MVNTIILRLRELLKDNDKGFQDYLVMLNVLSENRDLQQQVKKAGEMITNINIEKMPFYQLGMEKGVRQGMEKGVKQGMEKGKQTLQESIIKILSIRFSELTPAVKQKICATEDSTRLEELLQQAMTINKLEEL